MLHHDGSELINFLLCFRTGKAGTLIIDDVNRMEGESLGNLQMLNVEGNIYLGAYMALCIGRYQGS